MKKRRVALVIMILIAVGGALSLLIKYREYLFEKYEWHRVGQRAEKRYKELFGKFSKHEKLSSMEVGEIATYFQLKGRYDEGINILKEIQKAQDDYPAFFSLSGLYAYKARTLSPSDERKRLVSMFYNNMMEGFRKIPERPLAYYMRGVAYGVLGCTEKSVEDFNRAIEDSKASKIVMSGDGAYVDRERFVSIVERDIATYKNFTGDCLLEEKM
ncbi:MAG: hypothetical protein ACXU9W_05055 [Thermodesulfobacteriota bacterium]